MTHASTLLVGFFLGVGACFSANHMIMSFQSQKVASLSQAYEAKNIMLNECMNTRIARIRK